jgi:hypothetical protein
LGKYYGGNLKLITKLNLLVIGGKQLFEIISVGGR